MRIIIAAILALTANALELEAEIYPDPDWYYRGITHHEAGTNCAVVYPPIGGNYIYHFPGCFCVLEHLPKMETFCSEGEVINPLWVYGDHPLPTGVCITPA